ncbi:MAG: Rieske (2Fe-2S) protein [Pseudomonadota bacterium]
MAEIFVCAQSDMQNGDRMIVRTGTGKELGVFFHEGSYYSYSNYCVHSGGPACEGIMIPRVLDLVDEQRQQVGQDFGNEMHFVCPWHGYEYDLKTGECVGNRKLRLKKYDVIVRDGGVYVIA